MLTADRSLVRAEEPALEERADAMHSGHEHVGGVRRGGLVDDHMIVAEPRQASVPAPRIREDTGPIPASRIPRVRRCARDHDDG